MPRSELRDRFKTEGFAHLYSGKFDVHGATSGRFHVPQQGDRVRVILDDALGRILDFEL
jgi:hypothetical protein